MLLKNIGNLLKQAQKMQGDMVRAQEELAKVTVTGQAGGGMVEITMDGKQQVRKVRIDPVVVDREDVEMLEDLIVAALNDVQKKVSDLVQESLAKVTGGLNIPGMNLPL